jgi:Zn-finger nucleic acid-binding protein
VEDLKQDGCLNDVVVAIPDKKGRVVCPQCGSQMENYGYPSSDKVQIDGCANCRLVWTDADELGVMAALHARSKKAHDEVLDRRARNDREAAHFRALLRVRSSFRRLLNR